MAQQTGFYLNTEPADTRQQHGNRLTVTLPIMCMGNIIIVKENKITLVWAHFMSLI